MLNRPPEPIQAPHSHDVHAPGPDVVHEPIEPGTFYLGPRHPVINVLVNRGPAPLCRDPPKVVNLKIHLLAVVGDTGIQGRPDRLI